MSSATAASTAAVQCKLVLLGESGVGKSSLVVRFVQNEFAEAREPTIGAAFLTQKCRLDEHVIKFEIWDTAGQERFHSLAPMYYRNAQAAVVVYDVTKSNSLDKAKNWIKELQKQANPNIVIALAGNKVDLVPTQPTPASAASAEQEAQTADDASPVSPGPSILPTKEVSTAEAQSYATEHNLLFIETSAKTGEGVVEVFTEIAKKIPLEHILAQSQKNAARAASAAGGRTGVGGAGGSDARQVSSQAGGSGNIDLNASGRRKDTCAC